MVQLRSGKVTGEPEAIMDMETEGTSGGAVENGAGGAHNGGVTGIAAGGNGGGGAEMEIESVPPGIPVGGIGPGTLRDMDEHKCFICLDSMIEPVAAGCSHRFCKYCLIKWFFESSGITCAYCAAMITQVAELKDLGIRIESQFAGDVIDREAEKTRRQADQQIIQLGDEPFKVLITLGCLEHLYPDYDFDVQFLYALVYGNR